MWSLLVKSSKRKNRLRVSAVSWMDLVKVFNEIYEEAKLRCRYAVCHISFGIRIKRYDIHRVEDERHPY